MNELNICIAGLGNVGSALIDSIEKNNIFFQNKLSIKIKIIGISAKSKNKQRKIDILKYKWFDDPIHMTKLVNCDVIVELIGQEKGISYDLIETALNNNINVVTGNKALIAKHGKKLFELAEKNSLALSFEAAVAGGIPIIKVMKNDIALNKIYKISGILNGTTNYILSKMEEDNLSFDNVLQIAKDKGFTSDQEAELDIGGLDAAHKLTILSTLAFGSKLKFSYNYVEGIDLVKIEDINFAKKLGFRIKLISESSIIDNQIFNFTSPKLLKYENPLSNVGGALNAVNIETDHLDNLFLEGQGAGGKPTASSVLSDLFDIAQNSTFDNLGFKIHNLNEFEKYPSKNINNSFYLRIMAKDKAGVLSTITNNFTDQGISVQKILQIPDNLKSNLPVPIIIITHKVNKNTLVNVITNLEKLDFVREKITLLPIHDN